MGAPGVSCSGALGWFYRSTAPNAAMAGGVPSSITFFKGGGEGYWSRSSKSLRKLGTASFNGNNSCTTPPWIYMGWGVQVMMGAFAKCTACASRALLTPAEPPQHRKVHTGTVLPCQCATVIAGSCSPCSDLRRDTENETFSLFPDPLVIVGSTGLSSHGCREGSVGPRVPWAAPLSEHQSHRNCCPLPGHRDTRAGGHGSSQLVSPAPSWPCSQGCFLGTGTSVTGADECQSVWAGAAGFCSACTSPPLPSSCTSMNSGCTLQRRCTLELMCGKQPEEHRRQGRNWKQPFLTWLGSTSSLLL